MIARYREPHRAYHDEAHIAEVLAWFDEVADGPGWERPKEVYCAIVWHDAVYEPGAKDNEERSAGLAGATAWALGVDGSRVAALIRLTARHGQLESVADADAAHFLDSDMAILGADREAFDRYDANIRREYAMVPDEAFRAGRGAFLRSVLAKPRIFFSEFFHARLDARARDNLTHALQRYA